MRVICELNIESIEDGRCTINSNEKQFIKGSLFGHVVRIKAFRNYQ